MKNIKTYNIINKLPNSWERKKLSDICHLKNGYAFKSSNYVKEGIPLIRISDIQDGEIVIHNTKKIKHNIKYNNYLIDEGDILIAMSGATTGKFGIYLNKIKAYQNQRVGNFIILDKNILNNKFLFYKLFTLKLYIQKVAYGGAQPNISSKIIENIKIDLPPLSIQIKIVEIIDKLFNVLEKSVNELKKVLEKLIVYRQAVLSDAFSGKLTNKNLKNGELPKGWKYINFGNVVKEFIRGPFGSSLRKEFFVPFGYKVYEQKNAIYQNINLGKYFINENKYQELKRFEVKNGDYIMSCSGTIGKLFNIPQNAPKGIINQALLIIRIDKEKILDNYFFYHFTSQNFQNLIIKDSKGTAISNLAGVKDLKKVPFLYCSLKEQQKIVEEIEKRFTICDKIEEIIKITFTKIDLMKQSILKKAFEGKLIN